MEILIGIIRNKNINNGLIFILAYVSDLPGCLFGFFLNKTKHILNANEITMLYKCILFYQ